MDGQPEHLFRAWCAPELKLLGFSIARPYCLGVALLLEAIASPFCRLHQPETEITPEDLLRALQICRRAAWPFRFVTLAPSWRTRLCAAWLHRHPKRFRAAVETFVAWIDECRGGPDIWEDEAARDRARLAAPGLLDQAAALLRKAPFSEDRVWSMPLGLLSWYYGAIAERENVLAELGQATLHAWLREREEPAPCPE